ncbi:PiggyBac transposable element-derived protein [Trinorchestia longiramus]|nr:PiggyBac transposable element-derived protein [Trinorchestia longiramus]
MCSRQNWFQLMESTVDHSNLIECTPDSIFIKSEGPDTQLEYTTVKKESPDWVLDAQNEHDSDKESDESPQPPDAAEDFSYEEESSASDSDSCVSTIGDSDTEPNATQNDSDTEVNETHPDDDMEEIEVQANQESGLVQSDGEWNDIVTATSRAFPFTGKEELLVLPANTAKVWPIDVYQLFVTDQVVDFIVEETNRYANQVIAAKTITRKSRLKVWHPTDSAEIKKFLGIVILMGINPLPKTTLHWSKSKLYPGKLIPDSMERDRFQMLIRMLHFCDNAAPGTSRMSKIQFLLDLLITNFQKTYKSGADLVVDESMVPFRGRVIFRQYIPGKSHKYGCKVFKLCTPEGYTWNLEVDCGESVHENSMGASDSVVVRLTRDLMDIGATIFMDNYYTSIPLAKFLLSRKTYMCGTARANQKHLPTRVIRKKLRKGEIAAAEKDQIKVFNWKDKRNVITVSTVPEHDASLIQTGKKTRQGVEVKKPQSVLDYNVAKKGVDICDQMSSYYSALKKHNKWYKKVAMELLTGVSIVNAWVLFNKYYCGSRKWSMLNFRESVILSLLTNSPEEVLRPGRRSSANVASSSQSSRSSHCLAQAEAVDIR